MEPNRIFVEDDTALSLPDMEQDEYDERVKQFVLMLTKLTQETGIAVASSGCCGKPSLESVEPSEEAGYSWIPDEGEFQSELKWIDQQNLNYGDENRIATMLKPEK